MVRKDKNANTAENARANAGSPLLGGVVAGLRQASVKTSRPLQPAHPGSLGRMNSFASDTPPMRSALLDFKVTPLGPADLYLPLVVVVVVDSQYIALLCPITSLSLA